MKCPFCSAQSEVLDSRLNSRLNHLRRRRQCKSKNCGVRFTTIEVATIIAHSSNDLLEWASEKGS